MATLIAISRTFLLSRLYYSVITFPVSFVQIQCGPLLLQRNFVISGWKGNATKQEMNMCIRGLLYYWILPSGEFHRKWFDKATFEFRLLYFSTKWHSNFSFRKKGNYIQLCVIQCILKLHLSLMYWFKNFKIITALSLTLIIQKTK